jgi:hypothetical protein
LDTLVPPQPGRNPLQILQTHRLEMNELPELIAEIYWRIIAHRVRHRKPQKYQIQFGDVYVLATGLPVGLRDEQPEEAFGPV